MVKLDKRLLIDSTLFGVLITLVVAAADASGLLTPLERWFYDQRALHCQHWTPAPTDRLVHIDIDDASVDAIGAWPWDRADVADIIDEIALAKPGAVALDVLFSEPQRQGAAKVHPDQRLAQAIAGLGNCVVAASFPFRPQQVGPLYVPVRDALAADPELSEAGVVEALRATGFTEPDLAAQVHDEFYSARRNALHLRIEAEPEIGDDVKLRAKILPRTDPVMATGASNAFQTALAEVRAARALKRLAIPAPQPLPKLVNGTLADAPLAPIGAAAAAGGFVNYPQFSDNKVRAVPLFLEHRGEVYPQFGLSLAWKLLGADPRQVKLGASEVVVPRGSLGDLRVPVRTLRASELLEARQDVPVAMNSSWFGGRDWATMYDPARRVPKQHLPITALWDASQVRRRIARNNETADRLMENFLTDEMFDEFALKKLPFDDVPGYMARIDRVLPVAEVPPEGDPKRQEVVNWIAALRGIREQNPRLVAELDAHRAALRARLEGKALLIGWTDTGVIADFLPTSLHARCPGVVLHGVIFNQILTGEVWRHLPPWATLIATVVVGGLTTLAVSFMSPSKALLSAAALLAGYLALNSVVLFDYGNLVLGAAGPVVAVGAVFSGGTLARLVLERWERARITRRFSSYVDPKIVDYVVKHPDQAHFEGQIREMTVVFCDVAGFTQLTEKHGSETVPMLNELWGAMVPVIRAHGGIVNKFLGDGVMFFYGAPEQSAAHARDAVATVLAMRKALKAFNEQIAAPRNWPALALRWGVSTGNMVVGDAGSAASGSAGGAADYTVLGDNVNLGSRLESANKAVGTVALINDRTVELAGNDGMLFRPIGRLCVVGKKAGVMTYEPLARTDEATDEQKRLAADTRAMVEAFLAGRLRECVVAIERMEAAHGRSKLTDLYRERCAWFMQDPSPEPFDCQITLTEK